jgi:hypothetical protein
MYVYHIVFIRSSAAGHLGSFHFSVIMENDMVSTSVQTALLVPAYLAKSSEVGLLAGQGGS